jgi:hypothetical protein
LAPCLAKGSEETSLHMKRIAITNALLAIFILTQHRSEAQFRVGVNINIGSQPTWGPTGYDYAQYYYLPDIDAYYYVPRRQFIYLSNGVWVFSASLPPRYRDYDLYSGYKVVINRPSAYLYYNEDRERYGRYRNYYHKQDFRRDRDDRDDRRRYYGERDEHERHGRRWKDRD